MLHWSKSKNSTNPRWPPDAILNYKKAFIENDRESSVLDSRHLQATFLKNISFLDFFPFQSLMLVDYMIQRMYRQLEIRHRREEIVPWQMTGILLASRFWFSFLNCTNGMLDMWECCDIITVATSRAGCHVWHQLPCCVLLCDFCIKVYTVVCICHSISFLCKWYVVLCRLYLLIRACFPFVDQWITYSLVYIMICRLCGIEPLFTAMIIFDN